VRYLIPIVIAASILSIAAAPSAQMSAGDSTAWKIDGGHSSPGFAVKHILVSTVRGRLGPMSGTVWYDGKNVSSIRADASIDVKKAVINALFLQGNATGLVTLARGEKNVDLKKDIVSKL